MFIPGTHQVMMWFLIHFFGEAPSKYEMLFQKPSICLKFILSIGIIETADCCSRVFSQTTLYFYNMGVPFFFYSGQKVFTFI